MIYKVYVDAAVKLDSKICGIGFVIFSEGNFIGLGDEVISNTSDSSKGESWAVGKALEYIYERINPSSEDVVTIFCDSLFVCKFLNKCIQYYKKGNKNIFDFEPSAPWLKSITKYVERIEATIKVVKIKSHRDEINPNSYVDRLAKLNIQ